MTDRDLQTQSPEFQQWKASQVTLDHALRHAAELATKAERTRCIKLVLKALEHALKHGEHADVILALHNVATDLELKP